LLDLSYPFTTPLFLVTTQQRLEANKSPEKKLKIFTQQDLRETKIRNFFILCEYYAQKASSMTIILMNPSEKWGPKIGSTYFPKGTGFSQNQDPWDPPKFFVLIFHECVSRLCRSMQDSLPNRFVNVCRHTI
jgi:hypothetical protein